MKKLLLVFAFYGHAVFAQSPYLSVNIRMDSVKAGSIKFKIDMKVCQPVKGSEIKDHFSNTLSTIDFKALKEQDISCGDYIANDEDGRPYNYHYGNQVFAWEKILVCRIVNWSSANWQEPMYVIMPVKLSSFVTNISLRLIEYQSGKMIWLDESGTIDKNQSQQIIVMLKDRKAVDTDDWPAKKILD